MSIIKLPPRSKAKPKQTPARKRADWDAIQRDYRTSMFTLRELQAKHGADHGLISRKSRKESWTQELSAAIRQATNARLAEALVDAEVTKSHQKVTAVVAASADENTRIILGHRTRLTDLALSVDQAKEAVRLTGSEVTCIREAAVFMQAVCNLAAATKTLIEHERKAYGLDSDPERGTTAQDDFALLLEDIASRGSRLPVGGEPPAF
jgi:hypothetical protein